jgi:hypothetical protein
MFGSDRLDERREDRVGEAEPVGHGDARRLTGIQRLDEQLCELIGAHPGLLESRRRARHGRVRHVRFRQLRPQNSGGLHGYFAPIGPMT